MNRYAKAIRNKNLVRSVTGLIKIRLIYFSAHSNANHIFPIPDNDLQMV
jgi:hypothetical protein